MRNNLHVFCQPSNIGASKWKIILIKAHDLGARGYLHRISVYIGYITSVYIGQIHFKSLKTIKKAYDSISTEIDRKMCTCLGLIPATTDAKSNQTHIG